MYSLYLLVSLVKCFVFQPSLPQEHTDTHFGYMHMKVINENQLSCRDYIYVHGRNLKKGQERKDEYTKRQNDKTPAVDSNLCLSFCPILKNFDSVGFYMQGIIPDILQRMKSASHSIIPARRRDIHHFGTGVSRGRDIRHLGTGVCRGL